MVRGLTRDFLGPQGQCPVLPQASCVTLGKSIGSCLHGKLIVHHSSALKYATLWAGCFPNQK